MPLGGLTRVTEPKWVALKAQNTAWCGGWEGGAMSEARESSWDTGRWPSRKP